MCRSRAELIAVCDDQCPTRKPNLGHGWQIISIGSPEPDIVIARHSHDLLLPHQPLKSMEHRCPQHITRVYDAVGASQDFLDVRIDPPVRIRQHPDSDFAARGFRRHLPGSRFDLNFTPHAAAGGLPCASRPAAADAEPILSGVP